MLISVHLPKTAGTSFEYELEHSLGDKLLKDYSLGIVKNSALNNNKLALELSANIRYSKYENIDCIHGHFFPLKYLMLDKYINVKFITWMRHPVDRYFSHFYYLKNNFTLEQTEGIHYLMIDEDWSFERFVFEPEFQNLYSQFLWGFPLEYFDFIGITEFYTEDRLAFSKKYGMSFKKNELKMNQRKSSNNVVITQELRTKIEKFHAKDMDLYYRALEMRNQRITNGN